MNITWNRLLFMSMHYTCERPHQRLTQAKRELSFRSHTFARKLSELLTKKFAPATWDTQKVKRWNKFCSPLVPVLPHTLWYVEKRVTSMNATHISYIIPNSRHQAEGVEINIPLFMSFCSNSSTALLSARNGMTCPTALQPVRTLCTIQILECSAWHFSLRAGIVGHYLFCLFLSLFLIYIYSTKTKSEDRNVCCSVPKLYQRIGIKLTA